MPLPEPLAGDDDRAGDDRGDVEDDADDATDQGRLGLSAAHHAATLDVTAGGGGQYGPDDAQDDPDEREDHGEEDADDRDDQRRCGAAVAGLAGARGTIGDG